MRLADHQLTLIRRTGCSKDMSVAVFLALKSSK